MKKFLSLFLVLLVIVAFSACGVRNERQSTQNPSASTEQQSAVQSDLANDIINQSSIPNNSSVDSTVSNNTSVKTISRQRAIELALKAAGVDKASVFDIEAELDRERGGVVWEVDFDTREYEYSYDINAKDGSIVKVERERND